MKEGWTGRAASAESYARETEHALGENLKLRIMHTADGLTLELVRKDDPGARIVLNDFAHGIRIVDSQNDGLDVDAKRIEFNVAALQRDPRHIFALFHELGHASVLQKKGLLQRLYTRQVLWARGGTDEKSRRRTVQDERDAWAEGIRIARQCRDKGFDPFALFKDGKDFSSWLRDSSLGKYEMLYHDMLARKGVALPPEWYRDAEDGPGKSGATTSED